MDQLIRASLSHTHYWYKVGMLKVLAVTCVGRNRASSSSHHGRLSNDISPHPLIIGKMKPPLFVSSPKVDQHDELLAPTARKQNN